MNTLSDDAIAGLSAFQDFSNACSQDPELRARVDSDPKAVLAERGMEMPVGVEVRVLANTDDTYYLAFPPDPNVALGDEMLDMVAGGKSLSTVGSAGSAGSVGSLCTTASSASTAGTVGSGGSAGGV